MIYLKRFGAWFIWGVIGSSVVFVGGMFFTLLVISLFHFAWWEPVDWQLLWEVMLHTARFMFALAWFLWVLFGMMLITATDALDELVDGVVKLGRWINKW